MERGHERGVKGLAQHGLDALFHFICGFIGKGDTENIRRGNAQLGYDICVTVGQGLGLAGARPRNDTDISFCFRHRFSLCGIQAV